MKIQKDHPPFYSAILRSYEFIIGSLSNKGYMVPVIGSGIGNHLLPKWRVVALSNELSYSVDVALQTNSGEPQKAQRPQGKIMGRKRPLSSWSKVDYKVPSTSKKVLQG